MLVAYVDESGSTGSISAGGSQTYTLGCIVAQSSRWSAAFDALVGHRRFLKARFRVPMRAEVKANHLLRNAGPFRGLGLGEEARRAVYRSHLRLVAKLDLRAFAVVIRKAHLTSGDPHEFAWRFLLQRLERLSTNGRTEVLVVHDEGDDERVRRLARKARRAGTAGSAFGTGHVKVPFRGLLDDPVPRKSHESYWLQLADLTAYAAFRNVHPPPARDVQIVPLDMWDELGNARMSEVNQRSGGPSPGIVAWPKDK